MTVEELIAHVRFSLDDEVEPYLVSDEQMLRWFNSAYMRLCLESRQWKFLHHRGLILSTVADQEEYELPAIREIDACSLYVVEDGETVRYPVVFKEYEHWVSEERVLGTSSGVPHELVRMPQNKWLVEPKPTKVWHLFGDVWWKPTPLELTDEPIWGEEHHELLKYEVLTMAATVFPEEHHPGRIMADVQANLVPLKRAFYRDYLEPARGARAML